MPRRPAGQQGLLGLEFPGEPDLRMFVYTAAPTSPSADALRLLATWAATQDQADLAASVPTTHQA